MAALPWPALQEPTRAEHWNTQPHPYVPSLDRVVQAGAEQIPTQPGQVLEEHSSEVRGWIASPGCLWLALGAGVFVVCVSSV